MSKATSKKTGGQPRSLAGDSTYYLTVRFTPVEKERLDEAIGLSGYSGRGAISNFVRDVLLSASRAVVEGNTYFEKLEKGEGE